MRLKLLQAEYYHMKYLKTALAKYNFSMYILRFQRALDEANGRYIDNESQTLHSPLLDEAFAFFVIHPTLYCIP